MKLYITSEQLNELNKEQQEVFYKITEDTGGHGMSGCCEVCELPNIGQMIKFLGDYWADELVEEVDEEDGDGNTCGTSFYFPLNSDLCDLLWREVKRKLKDDN